LWLDLEKEVFEVADLSGGEVYLEKEVTAKIKEWSWGEQKQVVVVIDEAARLIDGKPEWRKRLYDWWRINPMKISFVYIVGREVEPEATKKNLGYLWTSFWQGRVWMPFQDKQSLSNTVSNQKKWHGIKISNKEVEQVAGVWGSWPCLARVLLRRLNDENRAVAVGWLDEPNSEKTINEVLADKEIDGYFADLWQAMAKESQDNFWSEDKSEYVVKTGLWARNGGKWELKVPWFGAYVKQIQAKSNPVVGESKGKIKWNGKNLADFLTANELAIMELLWARGGGVVSREELAKRVWGEKMTEKYSDWAIDKMLARLRKKLGDSSQRRWIQVVKGRGVRLNVQ
jgi:DNA-binding winged helix-turn-helix (wHTH) protein